MSDEILNVAFRLAKLEQWAADKHAFTEYQEHRLRQIESLKMSDSMKDKLAAQVSAENQFVNLIVVREPLDLFSLDWNKYPYQEVRAILQRQYATLTKEQKQLWSNNLRFLWTPSLRDLDKKIANVREYRKLGQRRNFLLGGPSGSGKTTFLNWLVLKNKGRVEAERNCLPILKADAPSGRWAPRALWQRMLFQYGATFTGGMNEEDLLMRLDRFVGSCGTELIIIDEIEQIKHDDIRRRVMDFSNRHPTIPIVCAACQPENWLVGDDEVRSRWNDQFDLPIYTGVQLENLLRLMELLLPFPEPSALSERDLINKNGEHEPGPLQVIEELTRGKLGDIKDLIHNATLKAINAEAPKLTVKQLKREWRAMTSNPAHLPQK